jgi:hypothetical protein
MRLTSNVIRLTDSGLNIHSDMLCKISRRNTH